MERSGVAAIGRPQPRCLRHADRRAGLHRVVRELAFEILTTADRARLADRMLMRLAAVLPARQLRLTELTESAVLRADQPVRAPGYVAFAVGTLEPTRRVVLEASVDPQAGLDDWTYQLLESVASLAGCALEIERLSKFLKPTEQRRRDGAAPLIGSSPHMQALRARVERVAATDFTLLIEGESGTGKELVARQVHDISRRRDGPFVAINCAALVETLIEAELFGIEERTATGVRGRRGKFEAADGGTLFLDEVSELSMTAQAKLLRAIQDLTVERVGGTTLRRVDTRIVAATNRRLVTLVERGLFRADLFYRLAGVEVQVPSLRQRRTDVIELAHYFLARHGARGAAIISPAAVDALIAYDWPGNVRELERMMEGAIATSGSLEIGLDDLPVSLRGHYSEILMPSLSANDTMRAWGSRYARLVLDRAQGNKAQACRLLDITYHTLNSYLRYRPRSGSEPLVGARPAHDTSVRALPASGSDH